MIAVVWAVAFMVCIAPMLGWKDPAWQQRVDQDRQCLVSQDVGYQVFATASSFYLPLAVILALYWRIFQTARKRIRRRVNASAAAPGGVRNPAAGGVVAGAAGTTGGLAAAVVTVIGRPLPTISEATTTTTTAFTNVSSANTSPEKPSLANGVEVDAPTVTDCGLASYPPPPPLHHHFPARRKVKDPADSKRERKAAKTLAIITGAFVVCWLPFFILAILLPVCQACHFNEYMVSFFLWLGYFNSTLNPIIYTIFSPEFRHAFKRILYGRRGNLRRRNRRLGVRYLQ
ncbi:5-hydroxytryptamine receptor-like isoform X2 [Bacillus rossius redtenbacheri]